MAILSSKITPPDPSSLVERHKLLSRLCQPGQPPVTWIQARAGAGKTSLISLFRIRQPLPSIWFRFDEGDRDIANFVYYLGQAASNLADKGKELPPFRPEYHHAPENFLRRWFEEMFALLGEPVLLIFEDCHLVQEFPFMAALQAGLETLPGGSRALLTSRMAPPATWIRWQANRRMAVIRGEDLAFNLEETSALLAPLAPDLAPERLKRLHHLTEGWAAGLILFALGKTPQTAEASLWEKTPEEIFGYLGAEVFSALPQVVQAALLQTSFLSTVPVEAAVAAGEDAALPEMLDGLVHQNQFLERHAVPPGYRVHQLFHAFLLQRWEESYSQAQRRTHQERAAEILTELGLLDEAAPLWIELEAWPRLAALMLELSPRLFEQKRVNLLASTLGALPAAELHHRPALQYWLAQALLFQMEPRSMDLLDQAFQSFMARGEQAFAFGCIAAASSAMLIYRIQSDRFSLWFDRLIQCKPLADQLSQAEKDKLAPDFFFMQFVVSPQQADPQWERIALANAANEVDPTLALGALSRIGSYLGWQGRSRAFLRSARHQLNLPTDINNAPEKLALLGLSMVVGWMALSLDEVRAWAQEIERIEAQYRLPFWRVWRFHHLAVAAMLEEDYAAAERLIQTGFEALTGHSGLDYSENLTLRTWLALEQGHDERAMELVKDQQKLDETQFIILAITKNLAALAALRLGRHAEALAYFKRVRKAGHPYKGWQGDLTYLAGRSLLGFAQGRTRQAKGYLRLAFDLAARTDQVNGYGFLRREWSFLCWQALRWGCAPAFAARMIRLRRFAPPAELPPLACWPWEISIRCLGGFEIEVRGQALSLSDKKKQRPLDLLKALAALGGKASLAQLQDWLWPEADGDVAGQNLTTNLFRLRKALEHEDFIQRDQSRLGLDLSHVWVDALALPRLVEALLKEVQGGRLDQAQEWAGQLQELYRGDFLPGEEAHPWVPGPQGLLRSQWLKSLHALALALLEQGQAERAAHWWRVALERAPLSADYAREAEHALVRAGRGRLAKELKQTWTLHHQARSGHLPR